MTRKEMDRILLNPHKYSRTQQLKAASLAINLLHIMVDEVQPIDLQKQTYNKINVQDVKNK